MPLISSDPNKQTLATQRDRERLASEARAEERHRQVLEDVAQAFAARNGVPRAKVTMIVCRRGAR